MATVNGIAKTNNTNAVAAKAASGLSVKISSKSVQERFEKMLGKESAGFLSSLLSLVNNNNLLQKAIHQTHYYICIYPAKKLRMQKQE